MYVWELGVHGLSSVTVMFNWVVGGFDNNTFEVVQTLHYFGLLQNVFERKLRLIVNIDVFTQTVQ